MAKDGGALFPRHPVTSGRSLPDLDGYRIGAFDDEPSFGPDIRDGDRIDFPANPEMRGEASENRGDRPTQAAVAIFRPEIARLRPADRPATSSFQVTLAATVWNSIHVAPASRRMPEAVEFRWGPVKRTHIHSRIEASPYILYDEHITNTDVEADVMGLERAMEGIAIEALAPGKLLLVRHHDEDEFRVSKAGNLTAPYAAHLRHRRNYIVNFRFFGISALAMALGRPRHTLLRQDTKLDIDTEIEIDNAPDLPAVRVAEFTHPNFLRDLHVVWGATAKERRSLVSYFLSASDPVPDIGAYFGGGMALGSGKYEPYVPATGLRYLMKVYLKLGLAEIVGDEFRVTEAGTRFLELMHLRSFDPDICHRWLRNSKATGQRRPLDFDDADHAIALYFGRIEANLDRHGFRSAEIYG